MGKQEKRGDFASSGGKAVDRVTGDLLLSRANEVCERHGAQRSITNQRIKQGSRKYFAKQNICGKEEKHTQKQTGSQKDYPLQNTSCIDVELLAGLEPATC